MVYRRLKDSPDSGWHFHTKCPGWPELGLVEAQLLKPDDDHICPECIKLDATPPTPPAGGRQKNTAHNSQLIDFLQSLSWVWLSQGSSLIHH